MADESELARARELLLALWAERAAELGRPAPADLAGACKFGALLAHALFGGTIRANYDHTWVELPDGTIVDLTEAAGVTRPDPYRADPAFEAESEFAASLASCRPRVERVLARSLGANERG